MSLPEPVESAVSSPPASIEMMGIPLHVLTERAAIAHVLAAISEGRGGIVVTPNIDHLRRCVASAAYRDIVLAADLSVADGMPLLWASRIAGTPLPEAVQGSNLIYSLPAAAAEAGRSVFLLGGDAGTAEGTARILSEISPDLRVAGTWCPPYGFESDETEMARLTEALVAAQPDIVFVGLGSPKQEHLALRLRACLPRAWWLGVGVSFSYVTGDVQRAPVWMRRCGLEWFHRVCSEPGRLARRYLLEGIPFGVRLGAWAVGRRLRG